jgi:hypothetical protein
MSSADNREAAFLCKITAATTHEIRNVLAIVQESSGLIEDMVRVFEDSGKLKPERVLRSVERIGTQVNRGSDLMTALNRVAHGLDRHQDRVDLHQEATQVAILCGRLAKQKGHKIQVVENEKDVLLTANRMHLEMALFAGLECCIEQLPEPSTVIMHSGRTGDTPTVDFAIEGGIGKDLPSPTDADAWNHVVECLGLLGATAETEGLTSRFRFGFPVADAG